MEFDTSRKPRGLKRIYFAFKHSIRGLKWLARNESAFRQEVVLLAITLMVIFSIEISLYEKVAMLCATLFVMFAEIINTAIEATIDRVSFEIHPLSGLAKDLGSAGVLVSMVVFMCVWGSCIYSNFLAT
ncbi:diacylglycerol kinase [Pseudoalteromonas byunsanensis]|uniref:Diacylglycerol kinase n=1 Tax=Pseudoalteromonas byunsanensis TaxID=327939 RepID=A0A1S1N2X9_9GAMM|nr:diacylglycerol kinase [Pseudoalteromonas byunsanensis]OHU93726.1 diacylglycerol kinase [Pseudoalteromonas byunsanensis]